MAGTSLHHLTSFAAALCEAERANPGGEVVVKCGAGTGRIFVAGGRLAWAVTSTSRRTFGRYLVESNLVPEADLTAVLAECKQTGKNFAETIIAWGLLDEDRLRGELLLNVASALLEVVSWTGCVAMFVPSRRNYSGNLTFAPIEVMKAAAALDAELQSPVHRLLSLLEEGPVAGAFEHLLDRLRRDDAAVSAAAQPATPRAPPGPAAEVIPSAVEQAAPPGPSEARLGAAGAVLCRLREVPSYRCSGLFLPSGRLLCADAPQEGEFPERLVEVGSALLDATRSNLQVATGPVNEIVLQGESGALVLRRCDIPSLGPVCLFLLLGSHDRLGLARLQLDRILPEVAVAAL